MVRTRWAVRPREAVEARLLVRAQRAAAEEKKRRLTTKP